MTSSAALSTTTGVWKNTTSGSTPNLCAKFWRHSGV